MDTELLRTFLEVGKTRHFGRAAESLYLTQSAVSFRIRQLESQLGSPLFSRQRGNVHLTPAGERLLPYAESILQTWGRARQDVLLSDNYMEQISIGASSSVWELSGISDWINDSHNSLPEVAFRMESVSRQDIVRALLEKSIDMALLGDPPKVEGFNLKQVASFEFKLVSTQSNSTFSDLPSIPLAYLDWSTRFSIEHARIVELQKTPIMHASSSNVIMKYLIANTGMAYLPEPVVSKSLDKEQLFIVEGAPIMEQSLYLCWNENNEKIDYINQLSDVPFELRTLTYD
ncbi:MULTISPECIES: HTH-type transcriptional regulator HdfR [Vibrio]|uniref:HTH-type transcriptional regulator HdfR n=1 Tax=Vibrio casei TaxID=673372 RepID=A0A368LHY6_9VIBR|nr:MULTISPECIES: HTH-type transcriptional regulator HdfR [Vibrio]RCS70235.1 HTH-type transcriptional regulator HdfR [Vibrio casei]SJN19169.1 Transcriptional regulator, LysR family [Vibrio casei]HBV75059.1 HTH-type transcriptional regulator HdfR [Vibrio sp.]